MLLAPQRCLGCLPKPQAEGMRGKDVEDRLNPSSRRLAKLKGSANSYQLQTMCLKRRAWQVQRCPGRRAIQQSLAC
jgi:hypothetical protein